MHNVFVLHRLQQSTGLLEKLQDRIERIHSAAEAAAQRRKEQDAQIEEAKKHLKSDADFRNSVRCGPDTVLLFGYEVVHSVISNKQCCATANAQLRVFSALCLRCALHLHACRMLLQWRTQSAALSTLIVTKTGLAAGQSGGDEGPPHCMHAAYSWMHVHMMM